MFSRLVALAFASIALTFGGLARAEAPTLSGTWTATGMSESWTVTSWGDDCGPKPVGRGAGGGSVQVTDKGGELSMSGAGRAFSTSECWEQMPGLSKTGHKGGGRSWSTTCSTPANDPRQARVSTAISATDSTISISERGNYSWNIKGQTCAASVARARTLTLSQREGEAKPAPPAPATSVIAPVKAAPRCSGPPGEPVRLEVHPGRKVLKPGETFAFRAVVLDAEGCAVARRPTWRLASGPLVEKVTLDPNGLVTVAEDAPEGRVDVTAAIGEAGALVAVDVVSPANYDELLASRSDAGDDEAAVAVIAAGSIGGATGIATDVAKQRKYTFVAIVFGIAALLGFVGLILARRGKHAEPIERGSAAPDSVASRESTAAPPPPEPAPRGAKGKICPTCGERYRAEATFCGKDATQLVPLN